MKKDELKKEASAESVIDPIELEIRKLEEEEERRKEQMVQQKRREKLLKMKREQKLKYECDEDKQEVKGIFRFFAVPGGVLSFCFRKYRWEPTRKYDLVDGQVYTLPIGVARHLNTNCWYPELEYIPGLGVQGAQNVAASGFSQGTTAPSMRLAKRVHRTAFQPLEFTEVADLHKPTKEIVTVQYM